MTQRTSKKKTLASTTTMTGDFNRMCVGKFISYGIYDIVGLKWKAHIYNGFGPTVARLTMQFLFIMPPHCCFCTQHWLKGANNISCIHFVCSPFGLHFNCCHNSLPATSCCSWLVLSCTLHIVVCYTHNSHFLRLQFLACHRLKARLLKMSCCLLVCQPGAWLKA